jgi:hypothetical protein
VGYEIKLLLMSASGGPVEGIAFLQKPFGVEEIKQKMRQLVGGITSTQSAAELARNIRISLTKEERAEYGIVQRGFWNTLKGTITIKEKRTATTASSISTRRKDSATAMSSSILRR